MSRIRLNPFVVLAGAYALRRSVAGGAGHRGPRSDHFDGTSFRNLDPRATAGRSFGDFVRWQRTARRTHWPEHVENVATPALPVRLAAGEMALTFVNHITFLLQFDGLNVLTDPVWSERASPLQWLGPRRVRAPGLAFEALPRIDLVLVSHDHYDHLDLHTLQRLQAVHSPCFVTTLGNRAFLEDHGLAEVHELDWWQQVDVAGALVTLTPAQHWSGRGFRGRNRTLWGGFVIERRGLRVFFAGDTGYAAHFRDIRARFGPVDLALLPIGAYEPRWFMRDQHMDPVEAVQAHFDLQARRSIGTHFGCFQLTDEGIDDPVTALAAARARRRLAREEFDVLETGETRVLTATTAGLPGTAAVRP